MNRLDRLIQTHWPISDSIKLTLKRVELELLFILVGSTLAADLGEALFFFAVLPAGLL